MEGKDFDKALESIISSALVKEDDSKLQAQNTIKYILFSLFGRINYIVESLHDGCLSVEIPDFLHHNKMDFDEITCEDFNLNRKLGISFTTEESTKSLEDFIAYRIGEVEDQWKLKKGYEIKTDSNYAFSQLIFENRSRGYLKGLFIKEFKKNVYLVITIVSKKKYFVNQNSFIYKIFSSIDLKNDQAKEGLKW